MRGRTRKLFVIFSAFLLAMIPLFTTGIVQPAYADRVPKVIENFTNNPCDALAKAYAEETGEEFKPVDTIIHPFSTTYVQKCGMFPSWMNIRVIKLDFPEEPVKEENPHEIWRFFEFEPGTIVHIDGLNITIEGCVYKNRFVDVYEFVRSEIGWDKVCFQTCTDDCGNVVVYYGSAE